MKELLVKYSKESLILVGVFVVIAFVLLIADTAPKDDEPKEKKTEIIENTANVEEDLTIQLQQEIDAINEGVDYSKFYETKESIFEFFMHFKSKAKLIDKGKSADSKVAQKAAEKLEILISEEQVDEYPKVRKAYFKFLRSDLEKEGIKVKLLNKRNKTLDFISPKFNQKSEIDQLQDKLTETLLMYRFNRTQFKLNSDVVDYNYFDLASVEDSEVLN